MEKPTEGEQNPVTLVSFRVSRALSRMSPVGLRRSSTFRKTESTKNIVTDTDDSSPPQTDRAFKWSIYRCVLAISVALLLIFAGVTPLGTIQSSMNASKGLGTASLSVHTAGMVIEALFLNSFLLAKLGTKWSILLGILLEAAYIGGNLYPRWWTLIPTALISGLGRPLLRSAEATYLSVLASMYARRLNLKESEVKTRFFSFFYVFYCSSRVVGNVMSSLILGSGIEKFSVSYIRKFMAATNVSLENEHCGADFCVDAEALISPPVNQSATMMAAAAVTAASKHVKPELLYQLCGYSFGCLLLGAIIIALFMDHPDRLRGSRTGSSDAAEATSTDDGEDQPPPSSEVITKPLEFMMATIKNWKKPDQILMIPLSIYNGMDNAFWQADFTKAFVTCTVGIHWVGFIVAWYGLTAPIAVLLFTAINKSQLRPLPFTIAFVAHLGTSVALLYWKPSATELPVLFGVSAAWGVGSGLWPYCVTSFYAIVFADNLAAGFSNYWFFDSIGATLSYAWSYSLCTWVKTVVLVSIMSVGYCGYILVEINLLLKKRRKTQAEIKARFSEVDTFPKQTNPKTIKSEVNGNERM